ncbi:hypothetical protein [Haladaptatus halobius]|uniref:hypothetical protein n=1 Tax=Haladaptatus halobius TaxID=2884875 RepID=UPI001D0B0D65|nr:hypothetical protein [Haladaptatus halobius]
MDSVYLPAEEIATDGEQGDADREGCDDEEGVKRRTAVTACLPGDREMCRNRVADEEEFCQRQRSCERAVASRVIRRNGIIIVRVDSYQFIE